MRLTDIAHVVVFSGGMSIGQYCFKRASAQLTGLSFERPHQLILSLLGNVPLIAGIALYGLLTIYWVWLLSFMPLSRAYPLMLLCCLILTSAIGIAVFHESFTARYGIGILLMLAGAVTLLGERAA